jgi:hypothetical protein
VSRARFLDGKGALLGYVPPGETRSWHLKVETPPAVQTSRFPVRVELFGQHGLLTRSGPLYVAAAATARPRLSHRVSVIPSSDRETLNVNVEVRNVGEAEAGDVRAFIEHPDSEALELVTATATAEHLAPGQTQTFALQAKLLKSASAPIEVKLLISEGKFNTFYEAKVELTPDERPTGWQAAPEIRIRTFVPDGEKGSYKLLAEALDDDGLASLWCRVDGKKVEYIDARDEPLRDIRFEVPWHPSDEGQRVEIVAIDAEGLRSTYVTDL